MSSPFSSKQKKSVSATSTNSAITYLPIETISPDPQNPRVHTRDQVKAIAHSISAFGFNAPILVNKDNQVVAGHGRLEAARFLGMSEVPVIKLGHLSRQHAKAYMLADNKLSDRSAFNDEQVAVLLKELQNMVLDFEIEATGFEVPEIDIRIQSLAAPDPSDSVDEIEEPEGPVVSRIGDVWNLGPHRLICGNSLDPLAYEALLGTQRVAAMFTDPPYNVRIDGHATGNGRKRHREFAMASGEMTKAEFTAFLFTFLHEAQPYMDPDAVYFMCMDWRHLLEATTAVGRCGCELINLCVWDKGSGGLGSLYRSAHELVLVARAKGGQHRNNTQMGRFGRNRTNMWHYPRMYSFADGHARSPAEHPTQKPVLMVSDAILDVTRCNDIVLDPFAGSGTTILAAERTGRYGYGIELDPGYVDLTISRWEKMTGQLAMHFCGKSFSAVSEERAGGDGQG